MECAAQCLVRREGVEHGVLLVISIHEFTPGVPGKRLMVSRLASQGCEDGAAQAVVVGIMLVAARAAVLVFLDAEGVGEDGGAIAVGEAAQHALSTGIVEVLLLVISAGGPLRQVVQDVVGERAGGGVGGAAGHVAKAIVAADAVIGGLGAVVGAGGPAGGGIEPDELMGVAGAIQVLLLRTAARQRALPQLAQVGVDIAVAVAGPGKAAGERAAATGAVACSRLCAGVARPHQPVLLIVAEVRGFAAACAIAGGVLRARQADHIAGRVIAQALAEDGAALAAVGPPGGRRAGGAQVGIVAELLGGQRPAAAGLEVEGIQLCASVVDQRRQVGRGAAVVAQPGERSRAVIDVGERVALAHRRGRCRGGDELIGVVMGEGLLEGRERWEGEVAPGRRELQALGDLLGDLALRVVRVRKVVDGEALGQPPFGVIGATPTHTCWISIVGVLHKGVIVATVIGGAGAARAGGTELRRLILHAAQPVQQVIGIANGTRRAGVILDEVPIGVIGIIVRAPVGVNQLREPSQVIVLRAGRNGSLHTVHVVRQSCSSSLLRGHNARMHIVNGIKATGGKGRKDGLACGMRAELHVKMVASEAKISSFSMHKGLTFHHYGTIFLACAKYATHVVVTSRIDLTY